MNWIVVGCYSPGERPKKILGPFLTETEAQAQRQRLTREFESSGGSFLTVRVPQGDYEVDCYPHKSFFVRRYIRDYDDAQRLFKTLEESGEFRKLEIWADGQPLGTWYDSSVFSLPLEPPTLVK